MLAEDLVHDIGLPKTWTVHYNNTSLGYKIVNTTLSSVAGVISLNYKGK